MCKLKLELLKWQQINPWKNWSIYLGICPYVHPFTSPTCGMLLPMLAAFIGLFGIILGSGMMHTIWWILTDQAVVDYDLPKFGKLRRIMIGSFDCHNILTSGSYAIHLPKRQITSFLGLGWFCIKISSNNPPHFQKVCADSDGWHFGWLFSFHVQCAAAASLVLCASKNYQ